MKDRLEQCLYRIVETDEKRFPICFAHLLLWMLSKFYLGISYWNFLRRSRSLPTPVISVGNIVLGGTGKTPVVELVARMLRSMGRKVAVLSRGYGRKPSKGTVSLGVVSDGRSLLLGVAEGGDEPQLLARNLPGVAVIVGPDRFVTGNYAISKLGADAIVLDDGYQYSSLGRDMDIVAIDARRPFGNGHVLPRGVLREPLSALKRADIFFLTHVNSASVTGLRAKLMSINPRAQIVESMHSPLRLESIVTGQQYHTDFLANRTVFALSSIGNPKAFEDRLERSGAMVKRTFRFSDHHWYSAAEIDRILRLAEKEGIDTIVTTQKDGVRLEFLRNGGDSGRKFLGSVNFLALVIQLDVVRGSAMLEDRLRALANSSDKG